MIDLDNEKSEDRFPKGQTKEEALKEGLEALDDVCFKFAVFTGAIKRFLTESGFLNDS